MFSVGEGSKLKIACTCSIVSYLHYINLNGLYIYNSSSHCLLMSVSCHCWVLRIHLQIRCSTSVHINIIINNLIDLIDCLVDVDLRFNVYFSNHGPYFHDDMDFILLICTLHY